MNLESLISMGAGAAALAYGSTLIRGRDAPRLHRRFGWLLLCLAWALIVRAVWWTTHLAWLAHLPLVGWTLFPLFAGLLVEEVIRGPLHRWAKLLLVGGVIFFLATLLTSAPHTARWHSAAMLVWHVACVGYLLARLLQSWRTASTAPVRSLAGAVALSAVVGLGLIVVDWLPDLGVDVLRVGSVAVVVLMYLMAAVIQGAGVWSVSTIAARFCWSVVACAAFASALPMVVGVDLRTAGFVGLFLLFAWMTVDPVVGALRAGLERDVWLHRLDVLDAPTLQDAAAIMRRWPELTAVHVVGPETLSAEGYQHVEAYFADEPMPASLREVQHRALMAGDVEHARAAEEVAWLLRSLGCDHVVPADDHGALLGLAVTGLLDDAARARFVDFVHRTSRIVAARSRVGG